MQIATSDGPVIAAVALPLSSCIRAFLLPSGLGPTVGPGQVRGRMLTAMEIRAVGAGPEVGN